MAFPASVRLWEAGARDGLQNEKQAVSTAVKIGLIERLADCGLTYIEAASFVSPKWVPQMADGTAVMAGLKRKKGVTYQALTPNLKGLAQAEAASITDIAVFAAASESFSKRNINCSIAESLERFQPVCEAAIAHGLKVRGFVSCALGCPFEGAVAPAKVAEVVAALIEMGCYEVALGDTIGVGTPKAVKRALEACGARLPLDRLGVHFHDTYGQALANIYAALEEGIDAIDASVAGLGGCPYAPGATGNVATEDVVYMLDGLGIASGVDIEALVKTAWWISDHLGRPPVSRVARAMAARVRQGVA